METKVRSVQTTVDKEYYVAFDGTEFEIMNDCVEYELRKRSEKYIYEHKIGQNYLENFTLFGCGCYNYDTVALVIRLDSDEAVTAVEDVLSDNFFYEEERERFRDLARKKETIAIIDEGDNGWYLAGSYEDVIKEFAEQVKELFGRN